MLKVSVNGYGTIGKRVADVVAKHPRMELIGICKYTPDADAKIAISKKFNVFAPKENIQNFQNASGTFDEMMEKSDVVVDASPDKMGAKNKEIYAAKKKKAIFQGGEKDNIGFSFNARSNFDGAKAQEYVRVVSCNTTALCRVIKPLTERFKIDRISAILIRRGADPNDSKGSALNSVEWEANSHHAHDVNTVISDIAITSTAFKAPQTLMHVHHLTIKSGDAITKDALYDIFKNENRVLLLNTAKTTADIVEKSRDLGFVRNDLFSANLLMNTFVANGNEASFAIAVPQESIVVPEDIDALMAQAGLMSKADSMRTTDELMGLKEIKSKMENVFG